MLEVSISKFFELFCLLVDEDPWVTSKNYRAVMRKLSIRTFLPEGRELAIATALFPLDRLFHGLVRSPWYIHHIKLNFATWRSWLSSRLMELKSQVLITSQIKW